MYQTHIDQMKGKTINAGTINQRLIKLIASPVSPICRESFGCGMTIMPPGHVHEPHRHELNEELIYVVSGSGEAIIGEATVPVIAGQIISLDKNEMHQFINTGTDELRLLWIYSPSGAEIRFADTDK